MKKRFSLLLAIVMMVSMLVPLNAFAAQSGDEGLQKAIGAVKQKFDIPAVMTEFSYDVTTANGVNVWQLNWSGKGDENGSVSVSVDDNGIILAYRKYVYSNEPTSRLPKISRDKAVSLADAFVARVNPSIKMKNVSESNENSGVDVSYNFRYVQLVNDLPYSGTSANIDINRDTGEVEYFYLDYYGNLKFDAPDKVIPMADAQKAYKEKIGLRLVYSSYYDNKKTTVLPVYVPTFDSDTVIDALSGEKVRVNDFFGRYYTTAGMGSDYGMKQMKYDLADNAQVLTPEEAQAVEEASKLLSQDAAEMKARAFGTAGITSAYKVEHASLGRGWRNDIDGFVWQFVFVKSSEDKQSGDSYVSIALDAKTGEIVSFNSDNFYTADDKAKLSEKDAQGVAEKFLNEVNGAKFKQSQYETMEGNDYLMYGVDADSRPLVYLFRYMRYYNGIPVIGDSLNVEVSAVSGKIFAYSANWSNVEFPAINNAITVDKAYEVFLEKIGLELRYTNKAMDISQLMKSKVSYDDNSIQPILVYAPNAQKEARIDAFTGELIDAEGKSVKDATAAGYTDIKGHYAENYIKELTRYGITLEGTTFKPDEAITQGDFLTLLAKSIYFDEVDANNLTDEEKPIDRVYKVLIREGIVKAGEKAPDTILTRENAVKFIVRAMHYDKIADIRGIYTLSFADKAAVDPSLVGYVAIAQGLKIIGGVDGKFLPKGSMTRGQAAVILYKFLQMQV